MEYTKKRNWNLSEIKFVAQEMYEDGSTYSERYSNRAWKASNWNEVDDDLVYKMLDCYIKMLRLFDDYTGKEKPEYDKKARYSPRRNS